MRIKFICLCQVSLFMDLKIAEEGSVSVASQAETDEHIASVRLWQQKREKRRCRNNHGVLILMTAIGQSQSESEADVYYLWKTMNWTVAWIPLITMQFQIS